MNKKIILPIVLLVVIIVGGLLVYQNTTKKKQTTNFKELEEQIAKEMNLSEGNVDIPSYPGAIKDEDKCGKDAFFVNEKSSDFVKNICQFLEEKGWKLNHPDYLACDEIKSFGGGFNYDKGQEKINISVIKYGEDGTCYWIYKRSQ